MDRELVQEELRGVKLEDGELSLEDLGNVYSGPNRVAMEGKALEHPELYRESQIDALVEAQIKAEEMAAAQEEQKRTMGL